MSEVEGNASSQKLERKPRLFIGIAIDEAARMQCAVIADKLRARRPNLQFVEPENYHLTLAFLGNVEAGCLAHIERLAVDVASRHRLFSVTLNRVGAFPHERKPRVIFIGSRGADPAYRALAADVGDACRRLGFPIDEKDDIPHATIARVPDRKRVTLPLIDVPSTTIAVHELTLFESVPSAGKVRYRVRAIGALSAA